MSSQLEVTNVMINNPFFGNKKICPDEDEKITQNNFYKYYNKIYLVLPLNSSEPYWFDQTINLDQYNTIINESVVIEKKISLGKVNVFFEWMKTVPKKTLKKCKIGSIDFDDIETEDVMVLPLFLLPFNQVNTFFEMYNEKDWFESFIINQKLAEYLKVSKGFYEIKNALEGSPISYWCKENNTKINVTNLFMNRNFRWNVFKSSNDSTRIKTIEELKKYNIKDDNYISMFFKTKGNFDDKFGKVNFKLHRLPKIKKFINQEQLNEFMSDLSAKNRFQLFYNLLVSPEYCHLILNNGEIWETMKHMVDRSKPLLRYCLFYSYLSLYLQENIKKSYLTKDDTCIIQLSNACHIPNFPYLQSDINSHPAIAAAHLISNKVIPSDNFYGIGHIQDKYLMSRDENTLNNLDEFRNRLNIFMTGNSSTNIFNEINWDKIHITGSVISACVPKKHPLLNLFRRSIPDEVFNKEDYLHHRYFCEYYGNSDIDVLITIKHPILFYERVLEFKKDIEKSCENNGNKINLNMDTIRKGYFKFNHKFIESKLIPYWKEKGEVLVFQEIMENITNQDYYKYFMPFYKEAREKFYNDFSEKLEMSLDKIKSKYSFFFSEIDEENIILNLYQKVGGKYHKVESENYDSATSTEESIEDEEFYEVIESTKYKIHHPLLNHPFEMFSVPYEDPWACINKFHMGPVRGYYDGRDVNLTISAIMSYHTNLSPDYRIMFGSKDPAEICNKYRMRGYGVILNKNELAQLITYSNQVPFWNNLYHVDKKNKKSIDNFLSIKKLTDNLFRPRGLNSDQYVDSSCYVPPIYDDIRTEYIVNKSQLLIDLDKFCKNNNPIVREIFFKHEYLTSVGKPKPLQRWMIDSAWDIFELKNMYQ